jgi:imidazolonepropionase
VSLLITNIGELVTNAPHDAVSVASPGPYAAVRDAALIMADGKVVWTGPASQAPEADEAVDAGGRTVLPGFVDSHAHLVFAGERGAEFAARMAGQPYTAGGIRSTVARPGPRPTTGCGRTWPGWRPRCWRRGPPPSSANPGTG